MNKAYPVVSQEMGLINGFWLTKMTFQSKETLRYIWRHTRVLKYI